MAFDLQLAVTGATVVLDLALALAVGAAMASVWLANGASAWSRSRLGMIRPVRLGAIAIAVVAMGLLLLFESALMAEVPLTEAGAAARSMLMETHYGMAWALALLNLFALGVFLYSRSMVSHAAANGDVSIAAVADWIHLCLISVWVGEVCIAGLLALAAPAGGVVADRAEAASYVESLSLSATLALAGIVATGLFSAWRNLGSIAGLSGNSYGSVLLVKLALVALAVLLGGFNRFVVRPALLADLRRVDESGSLSQRRFARVLRIEAVVLLAVLVAAAVLSSTSPPTAA
jgi:putative copper resistance protein D